MANINYGPLEALIGEWKGDKGVDIAPDPDGTENNPYYETITYTAIGTATNAEQQTLAVLHYLQIVQRQSDDQVFHHQTGYWMWDENERVVMQSLTIPRGITLLAGGNAMVEGGSTVFTVSAAIDSPSWQVSQSPFMRDNAKTTAYKHSLKVKDNDLSYSQTTMLDIYGKTFEHTDKNELQRV